MPARWTGVLAVCVIVFAALAAYYNSFSGPFVLDDTEILDNPTIRHLWPVWTVLSPPTHAGVGGRPLLNLSYAINYALGGTAVQGYHWLNLAVHILAGLTLCGLVRRTLLRPVLSARFGPVAAPLALAVAVLWILHPLLTGSVTYVSQRAESLMALWYLLTLYCFVRGADQGRSVFWPLASVVCCFLGMATKEVMVSAPLMVWLYDRTFFAGTFREAWRRRWRFYLGLMSSWVLLGCLLTGLHQRGVGFGHGISWWVYALTECWAIVRYLGLALWPHPLVFDYGMDVVKPAAAAAPYGLVLAGLVTATVLGLWRRPALGFAGAWVFLILAPTSSVVPVAGQPMAENRMYLPLIAVVVMAVLGLYAFLRRRSVIVFLALAVGLGFLTARRNVDYQSELSLWRDTVAKRPGNVRAHDSLGNALDHDGQTGAAIEEYTKAVGLAPDDPREHYNLGRALEKLGRTEEATAQYEEALRLNPNYADAHNNLGVALAQQGRMEEAIDHCRTALRLQPDDPGTHYNLGMVFLNAGRLSEAAEQYQEALRLNPAYADAHLNLGDAYLQLDRLPDALGEYESALQLKPDDPLVHTHLGIALFQAGHAAEAMEHFQRAEALNPDYAEACYWQGNVLTQAGQIREAIRSLEKAVRLKPGFAEAHNNLGMALLQVGRVSEAIAHFEEAVRLKPDYARARNNLETARQQAGQ